MANSAPNSENNDDDGLNENAEDTNVSNRGGDITVPGISEDEKANENSDEHASPKGGGDITVVLTLTQILLMNTDTRQNCKLTVPIP